MAGRELKLNNSCERYERYNFNASEDDYIVSDILINLEALIRNSNSTKPQPITTCSFNSSNTLYEPTWLIKARNLCEPLWHDKRKRSALDSPPRVEIIKNDGNKDENPTTIDVKTGGEIQECMPYSPSSPLSYEAHNHNNHTYIHLKHKSRKRKLKDWEEQIQVLEQTKQQLKLSLDNVKKYHQTLLQFNTKLKNIRDEKNGESKRKNSLGNRDFDQLPICVGQQQEYSACQQSGGTGMTIEYHSVPFLQAKSDKNLQAAEARYRRKIKINAKKMKNSISLGIRNSTS